MILIVHALPWLPFHELTLSKPWNPGAKIDNSTVKETENEDSIITLTLPPLF